MQEQIYQWLNDSLAGLSKQGLEVPDIKPQVSGTKNPDHGDFTSNIALILAPGLSISPRDLAQRIVEQLPTSDSLDRAEVAGAGFINFYLKRDARAEIINTIIAADCACEQTFKESPKRILLEYVSANPTGPLHVGHGRGAAYGETIATLLEAVGHRVEREYYVNDAGRQMDILLLSVWFRYLALGGVELPFPPNAYQGDYIWDIAADLRNRYGDEFNQTMDGIFKSASLEEAPAEQHEMQLSTLIADCKALLGKDTCGLIREAALTTILNDIKSDLQKFNVRYDHWFSERQLFADDAIPEAIQRLKDNGHIYTEDGALWFRSTAFGDDKDRVLQRNNGEFTYFASDVAYHLEKYRRGYDLMINVWGADHHGYVARLKAAMEALGLDAAKLVIILVQFANLYRGKQKVAMSTRAGEFITLRGLYEEEEVGVDAARFFYIMRKPSQHLDFDIELAKAESINNPVYYVQYAHARICSVFKQLRERGMTFEHQSALLERLQESDEQVLIKSLYEYQKVLLTAAEKHEPHRLLNFVYDLASDFHGYYNRCKFLVDDADLRNARLSLLSAVRIVMRDSLRLFGVSAPEEM